MNIRVDLNTPIKDGTEVVFRSPVDCSQVTGLKVYYIGADENTASQEFAFADAHGNNVGDIDHLFAENVAVKVILDVTTGMAFVQNADTNAYLEGRFQTFSNTLTATKEGSAIKIDDISPLQTELTLELATNQFMHNGGSVIVYGKNLINYRDCVADTCKVYRYPPIRPTTFGFRIAFDGKGQTAKMPIFIPANTQFVISYTVRVCPTDHPKLWYKVFYTDGTSSAAKTYTPGTALKHEKAIEAIRFGMHANCIDGDIYEAVNLQVEIGESATEYVSYAEPKELPSVDIKWLNDTKTFSIEPELGATIFIRDSLFLGRVKYNRDIAKAFAELQNAIIALGGNI